MAGEDRSQVNWPGMSPSHDTVFSGGGGGGAGGWWEGAVCNITDLSSVMAVFSLASWRHSFPSILLSSFVQTVQLSGGGPNAVGVHMDVEIQLLTDLEF